MHRIVFVIDQKLDFFLSLAWVQLLRRFHPEQQVETWAVLVKGVVYPEFEPYLGEFDRIEVLDGPYPPGRAELLRIPAMVARARRFHREVRALGLGPDDVVVAYSFRELVLNSMIRALKPRPHLVRVRGFADDSGQSFTRRRPHISIYRNVWNRAFGHSALRYRWTVDSNRHAAGRFIDDPYDDEFRLTTLAAAERAGELAWPYPVLREAYAHGDGAARPTIVFLGEIYPPVEGMPLDEFRPFLSGILAAIRAGYPEHRHVFKPRSPDSLTGLDLTGWEVAYVDDVVESLMLKEPAIEKVLSFKSSGSLVAAQYGCEAYVLYPLLDLPAEFRTMLDGFFADYRDTVTFVSDLEQVLRPGPRTPVHESAARVAELARPLIDLLANPPRGRR